MTRKDYALIAEGINQARHLDNTPEELTAIKITAEYIASKLANNNPRFDRSRFLSAAGVTTC